MSTRAKLDPYNTELSRGNAYWMARLSKAVYTEMDNSAAPDEEKIKRELQGEDPDFLSVRGFNKNSAQAMLVEHKEMLCMVFRGTDEPADWLDNLNVFSESVLFGEFHRGFWKSVGDVWTGLYDRYEELRAERKRPLFITGHSLGGAMATVAASRLIHEDKPFISVYTFGQPRSMRRDASRIFNSEAGSRCFRFQNNEDIVTRVPARLAGYSHVGKCIYIDTKQRIHTDPGHWYKFLDTVEGALKSITDENSLAFIGDHDVAKYLAAVKKWNMPE